MSCSLERQFLRNPSKAAELCNIHYGVKDLEYKEVIIKEIVRDTIKGDSIPCPSTYKPIEVLDDKGKPIINPQTGKPEIKYIEVPGPKVKCPDNVCEHEVESKLIEKVVRDKSQDKILQDTKEENIKIKQKYEMARNTLIVLAILFGGYIIYRVIKYKIKSKIT